MKIRTRVLTLAAGAAVAAGAFALPGSASALTWDKAIMPNMSVSGSAQSTDRTADWTRQVSAMQVLRGTAAQDTGPVGFFESARTILGATTAKQVAER